MGRILRSLVYSAAVLLPLASPAPGSHKQKAPIALRLEAPKQPLKAGKRLLLRVKVTDTSDHKVSVGIMGGETWGIGVIYQVHVHDQRGHTVPLRAPISSFSGGTASVHGVVLAPGQSVNDHIPVTTYYDLNRPGKYTIWIAEPFGPNGRGPTARSNTITVTVVKQIRAAPRRPAPAGG